MITKEQALTKKYFEHVSLTNADGTPVRARRNGKTKTWKTRPEEFKIPIKIGMYVYGYITDDVAAGWRVPE